MKKTFLIISLFFIIISTTSCTSNDVKEISGTLVFNEIGDHSFNINAENIEATITIAGPNKGETIVFENIALFRTVDYTAKIGVKTSTTKKNELLNNLVVMYVAKEGKSSKKNYQNFSDAGYVKIDWKGIY
ncbi:MAG: hypothetical protein GQ552_09340 [Flavobacteriaceae bacterium]|nr:hypothetical protein [Flavobacteriaceae bacterium]